VYKYRTNVQCTGIIKYKSGNYYLHINTDITRNNKKGDAPHESISCIYDWNFNPLCSESIFGAYTIIVLNPTLTIELSETHTIIESVQPTSLSLIQFSIKKSIYSSFPTGSVCNGSSHENIVYL